MYGLMRGNDMLCNRIITSLLLRGNRLVKGTRFQNYVDVGDPISQAMIASDQGADEVCLLDIDASRQNRVIDYKLVERVVDRCQIPLSVGGGIRTIDDVSRLVNSGAERIVINSSALWDISIIGKLSKRFGSQSVVVAVDIMKNSDRQDVVYRHTHNTIYPYPCWTYFSAAAEEGAGEFLITDISREGTLTGFNYDLYKECCKKIEQPIIASGGAGCYDDIAKLFKETSCTACAIGKMLCLRHYDIIGIKSYIASQGVNVRHT